MAALSAGATNNHPKPDPASNSSADSTSLSLSNSRATSTSDSTARSTSVAKQSNEQTQIGVQATTVKTGDVTSSSKGGNSNSTAFGGKGGAAYSHSGDSASQSVSAGGSADSSSSSSGGNAASDNDTTVTVEGDTVDNPDSIKFRAAPSIGISSVQATAPCIVGVNVGASVVGFGAGFGGGKEDEECSLRETARLAAAMNQPTIALALLCSSKVVAKTIGAQQCGEFAIQDDKQVEANRLAVLAEKLRRAEETAAHGVAK